MGRRSEVDVGNNRKRPGTLPARNGWAVRAFGLLFFLFVTLIALGPTLLSSPNLANRAIERFGGLQPLRVTMSGLSLGWFTPVSIANLKVQDEQGILLLSIEKVVTAKGLLGWISSPYSLGVIEVDGLDADVIAGDGTTNLEQALSRLITLESDSPESQTKRMLDGRIAIHNSSIRLSEAGRPERWLVEVPSLQIDLPEPNQLFGPIELKANIVETGGTVGDSQGQIKVQAKHVQDGSIELRARMENLSLHAWHVLRARWPEIPIIEVHGWASGVLAGSAVDSEHWAFEFQQLQVEQFEMAAPDWIGPSPARLQQISIGSRVALNDQLLQIGEATLDCDVGSMTMSASFPWPIVVPSLQEPFIPGATFTSEGSIDIPQLVEAAQSLLPLREDIRLVSGTTKFSASQHAVTVDQKHLHLNLTFSDVSAISGNQEIGWKDPLTVQWMAEQRQAGPQFELSAQAEFCDLKGWGTFENGQLDGRADLDLLHQRLNQFMDLPISQMTGSAQLQLSWNSDAQQQVTASGSLSTSPILIATASGNETREPAWKGDFSASIGLDPSKIPVQINKLHVELVAPDEQLAMDLHEPLQLFRDDGRDVIEPAAFSIAITGDMANWKRRGWIWLTEPPDVDVSGQMQMAVSGKLGLEQIQILQANWDLKPVTLQVSEMVFAEPQLIGNFKGRIDSNDWTRLQVDQLTVQANSFWVVARDEPTRDGKGRSGQARWMLDFQRMAQNLREAMSVASASNESLAALAAAGTSQGDLKWLVDSSGATFQVQGKAEELFIYDVASDPSKPSTLWSEPTVSLALSGEWAAETGAVEIRSVQFETPWASYQGQLAYRVTDSLRELAINGQAEYDAVQLTQKLEPTFGRNIQLAGQQQVPIEVRWQWADDAAGESSIWSGLDATAQLGWSAARVVGIEVGRADVPISIRSGTFVSKAEIPVSGGVLRWDVESDLTQDVLTIEQKPMTVLENVAITPEMCSGWLKYVAPLVAEATSIDGRLSLTLEEAKFTPGDLNRQTAQGRLVMHRVEVGPGPLANEVTGLIRQIEAIRRADPGQAVSSPNRVWLQLPSQQVSFRMIAGKVHHRDLRMEMGEVTLTTSGSVDVDGGLEMMVSMPIPDAWTERGPVLATLRGQTLQFPVRGTVSRPQLDASVLRQFGRQAIEGAAQGLLQQGINRGLERLFRQQ